MGRHKHERTKSRRSPLPRSKGKKEKAYAASPTSLGILGPKLKVDENALASPPRFGRARRRSGEASSSPSSARGQWALGIAWCCGIQHALYVAMCVLPSLRLSPSLRDSARPVSTSDTHPARARRFRAHRYFMGIVHLGRFAPIEPVAAASTISVLRTDALGFAHPGQRRSALLPTSGGTWELESISGSTSSARGTKGAGGVTIPLPLRLAQRASVDEDAGWNAPTWTDDTLASGGAALETGAERGAAAKSQRNGNATTVAFGNGDASARAGAAAFASNAPYADASVDAYADADMAVAVDSLRSGRDTPPRAQHPRLRGGASDTGSGLGALAMPRATARAAPRARPSLVESAEEPFGRAARRAAYGAGASTFGEVHRDAAASGAPASPLGGDVYDVYGDYGLLA